MATFKNVGIFSYELPGDGTRPAALVEPGGTVEADTNPNALYFEHAGGDPPAGAGDFNPPETIPQPAQPEPEPSPPAPAAQPEES